MTQIVLNISNPNILNSLKEILQTIDGVTIDKIISHQKNSIDKSLQEIENGEVVRFDSVDQLMEDLLK